MKQNNPSNNFYVYCTWNQQALLLFLSPLPLSKHTFFTETFYKCASSIIKFFFPNNLWSYFITHTLTKTSDIYAIPCGTVTTPQFCCSSYSQMLYTVIKVPHESYFSDIWYWNMDSTFESSLSLRQSIYQIYSTQISFKKSS